MIRDDATGLPTKYLLEDRLILAMAQHQRKSQKAVLLLLESQKKIEPEARKLIGQRMQHAIRSTDIVSIIDEHTFGVLLTELNDSDNAIRVADVLLQRCQQPYQTHGRTLRYHPVVGMAVYPDDGNTPTLLMERAAHALKGARAEGPGTYQFYTEDMNVRAHRRRTLTTALKKAWARDELVVYGQPSFSTETGAWVSTELLLRWEHPEHGVIAADTFSDIAHSSGLWAAAAEKLLMHAVQASNTHPSIRWTFNAPSLPDFKGVDDAIPFDSFRKAKVNHANIGLEIPEQMLSLYPEVALRWMQHWTDSGGFIAIDNVGEHAVPGVLWHTLPISELKSSLPSNISFMHALANSLNWRSVYKNIEHATVWDTLPRNTNVAAQGNGIHPVVSLDDILKSNPLRSTEH